MPHSAVLLVGNVWGAATVRDLWAICGPLRVRLEPVTPTARPAEDPRPDAERIFDDGRLEWAFTGEVIEWRGPAPYLFVAMTAEDSEDLKEAVRGLITGMPAPPNRPTSLATSS